MKQKFGRVLRRGCGRRSASCGRIRGGHGEQKRLMCTVCPRKIGLLRRLGFGVIVLLVNWGTKSAGSSCCVYSSRFSPLVKFRCLLSGRYRRWGKEYDINQRRRFKSKIIQNGQKDNWQLWDLNPRPFGPEPKSGALDHSAKLSCFHRLTINKFCNFSDKI